MSCSCIGLVVSVHIDRCTTVEDAGRSCIVVNSLTKIIFKSRGPVCCKVLPLLKPWYLYLFVSDMEW